MEESTKSVVSVVYIICDRLHHVTSTLEQRTHGNQKKSRTVDQLPSGELTCCYGKIHHAIFMGKSTISTGSFFP